MIAVTCSVSPIHHHSDHIATVTHDSIETSGEISEFMKMRVINLAEEWLQRVGKRLYGAKIVVMDLDRDMFWEISAERVKRLIALPVVVDWEDLFGGKKRFCCWGLGKGRKITGNCGMIVAILQAHSEPSSKQR